ncbi:hypothetical protein CASFOL_031638 [Castilleja foliolosa]|uniref:BHLH domain-containing protein n=1 Tax=Castilleja foliolosa TaxID=1961234 RepID=A0ABD3C817_9LAMI
MAAPPDANSDWAFDLGLLDDLPALEPCFQWDCPQDALPPPTSLSPEFDESYGNPDCMKKHGSRKRLRPAVCSSSDSKAFKEKMRRDRLNERFQELSALLEHGKPIKIDKNVVLSDTIRMVIQLRGEAKKLKESNDDLQGKVNELKMEKNELRDEKTMLKANKEKLERQVKELNARPQISPHHLSPMPSPYAHIVGSKFVPVIGFSGVPMWQMMPPTAVDTSEDHTLRPPVA